MSASAALPQALGSSTLIMVMAAFFVLAMGQALHVSCQLFWRVRPPVAVAYEALLAVHLLCGFCVARAAVQGFPPGFASLLGSVFLAFEAVLAVWGAVVAVLTRRPGMLPELACILLTLPVCVAASTAWAAPVLVLDAAVMAGRVACALVGDGRARRARPGPDAMAEAVRLLPEGVLCTSGRDGRVLFMNDAMRSHLAGLGLPCDLADLSGVWGFLEERARRGKGCDAVLPESLRIEVAPGRVCLFVRSESVLRGRACRWVVALDVTEEERAAAEVAQAARVLEQAGEELGRALRDVGEVARNEALISMHARVHDVIGQRLSIVHRYIEDGAPDASFGQLAALISGMSAELRAEGEPQAPVELAAVVDAFALAGVRVSVEGELPADPEVALLFVQVVRECATNAVRHGRSREVEVRIEGLPAGPDGAARARLSVSNEGAVCEGSPRPGGGLSGMRAATLRLGGAFTVCAGPPFTVQVDVALPALRVPVRTAQEGRPDDEGRCC